jgi:glycosyltransferase involved in cell wall biosynthesis
MQSSLVDKRPIRFSVVIPAYNEERLLARCLESLAAQHCHARVEVIVVDNASTDETAAIAHAHGAKVMFEQERGVCSARQRGTEAARGEIVVSTDADTTFAPGWLSKIDEHFEADDRVAAVAGSVSYVDAPLWGRIYVWLPFYVSACNLAFKRSAWTGYNTRLTQGGDEFDQLRRLKRQGRIVLDKRNPTFTSSRRLQKGFLYSVFVTAGVFYVLDYLLGRVVHRSIFGSYPAIRSVKARNQRVTMGYRLVAALALALFALSPLAHHALHAAEHLPHKIWHHLEAV